MPVPYMTPDVDTTAETFTEWPIICEHENHHELNRGHSDETPVLAVVGLPLPCCGAVPMIRFLCEGWCKANVTLRCSNCDKSGLLFEDCYVILGAV